MAEPEDEAGIALPLGLVALTWLCLYLPLAEAAGADWLVTGGRRSGLLARGHLGRAWIVRAAEFCETAIEAQPAPGILLLRQASRRLPNA